MNYPPTSLCWNQGERGMDGASTVGPPGPRGPPGRIEVLSSVSIIRVRAWLCIFFLCQRREQGGLPLRGLGVLGMQGTEPAPGVPTCQHASPDCACSNAPPPQNFPLVGSICGQLKRQPRTMKGIRVLRKPQLSRSQVLNFIAD